MMSASRLPEGKAEWRERIEEPGEAWRMSQELGNGHLSKC